jgi:hypothetical protein
LRSALLARACQLRHAYTCTHTTFLPSSRMLNPDREPLGDHRGVPSSNARPNFDSRLDSTRLPAHFTGKDSARWRGGGSREERGRAGSTKVQFVQEMCGEQAQRKREKREEAAERQHDKGRCPVGQIGFLSIKRQSKQIIIDLNSFLLVFVVCLESSGRWATCTASARLQIVLPRAAAPDGGVTGACRSQAEDGEWVGCAHSLAGERRRCASSCPTAW